MPAGNLTLVELSDQNCPELIILCVASLLLQYLRCRK